MKNKYLIIGIIVIILIVGYLARHKIKTLISGPITPTTEMTTNPTPTETGQATNSAEVNSSIVMTKSDSVKGNFLTDPKGMTLYIFDKDTKDKSNCTGTCLAKWPIYAAPSTTPDLLPANMGVIKRSDGSMQYTLNNMPLYYYAMDKQPGDTTGDGVAGIWHIVKP